MKYSANEVYRLEGQYSTVLFECMGPQVAAERTRLEKKYGVPVIVLERGMTEEAKDEAFAARREKLAANEKRTAAKNLEKVTAELDALQAQYDALDIWDKIGYTGKELHARIEKLWHKKGAAEYTLSK